MKPRKQNRLTEFDYSSNGTYFITICTKDRQKVLCDIVGGDALGAPYIKLSEIGNIVNEEIIKNNVVYQHINIEKYIIMPNHIHLIVMVMNNEKGTPRASSPTRAIIPQLVSTFKRFVNKRVGKQIWQRSYHDHIIRNSNEYLQIWQYIDQNPLKWELDEYYME